MTAPQVRFEEPAFHDDDIAAGGDEVRDVAEGKWPLPYPPRQEDLA